jgi:hypothetical protein
MPARRVVSFSALSRCALYSILVVAPFATGRASAQAPPETRPRLEVVEDLSESLANDVLDLSVAVRDREWARIERFFGPTVAGAPLPCVPGPIVPRVKWIADRAWTADASAPAAPRARAALLDEWRRILDHYGEIEDVRFKVRGATFEDAAQAVSTANVPTALPGAAGHARIGFWIVGRNREGRREWLRGSFEADVRYPEGGPWQIVAADKAQVGSMIASVDLFSEVSLPAGVSERIAAYGSRENSGFVWKGAAAGDVNGDGWIDLFVTGTTRNFLYLNEGNGHFRDASAETGVRSLATGSGPLLADVDNDGDLDVFIAAVGPQVLLENRLVPDGRLRFEDVSIERGVAVTATGFSAAAADVNADGRVDFYVASYNAYGRVTPNSWSAATNGTPNLLFVSQPDGGYREEAAKWGVNDGRWSYAAVFADLTDDGRPDLFVANDFGEKGFFVHQGTSFKDEARERGVLDPGNGMGVSVGDYNNDGRLDLHVTNMSSTAGNRILGRMFPGAKPGEQVLVKLASGNALFENLGGGRFREVTAEVGGLSGMWAWGGGFLDFDNDGVEDLYTPNGFISGRSMKDT